MAVATVVLSVLVIVMLYLNQLLLSALIHSRRSARSVLPLIVDSSGKDEARPVLDKFLYHEDKYTNVVSRVPRWWGL